MNKRYMILAAVIGALTVANLWRWLASEELATTERAQRAGAPRAEDFTIKVFIAGGDIEAKPRRDLFRPKIAVVRKPPVVKKIEPPPEPPPKTPEQLEEEAARAELGQVKCVGVAFRHEKGQAFMMLGGQAHVAGIGDKVGSRFVVEKITADGVYIRDPRTNVSAQLPVSGG